MLKLTGSFKNKDNPITATDVDFVATLYFTSVCTLLTVVCLGVTQTSLFDNSSISIMAGVNTLLVFDTAN